MRSAPAERASSYRTVDPPRGLIDADATESSSRSFARIRQRILRAALDRSGGPLDGLASDLRPCSSPRHDQRNTSSCVSQSTIKAAEIKHIQRYGQKAHVALSVEANYILARELMVPPETQHDDGTYVSTAFDALRRFGVCTAAEWPFDPDTDRDRLFTPPPWSAMRHAFLHKITEWHRIDTSGADRISDVIANLAVGNPVVFGTVVGDSWQRYKAGDILGRVDVGKGRHATVLVGWDPSKGVFIDENSWGNDWGDDGFCFIAPEVIGGVESEDFHVMTGGWEDWVSA